MCLALFLSYSSEIKILQFAGGQTHKKHHKVNYTVHEQVISGYINRADQSPGSLGMLGESNAIFK